MRALHIYCKSMLKICIGHAAAKFQGEGAGLCTIIDGC